MAWVILGGQALVLIVCLVAIRSFGKWTKQLLHTERSNQLILKELKLISRPVFRGDATNHVAGFAYEGDDEEKSA